VRWGSSRSSSSSSSSSCEGHNSSSKWWSNLWRRSKWGKEAGQLEGLIELQGEWRSKTKREKRL